MKHGEVMKTIRKLGIEDIDKIVAWRLSLQNYDLKDIDEKGLYESTYMYLKII